jgi:hypothetical protein
LLPASGYTRLERKMYSILFSGSIQTQVPVKPVWPNVLAGERLEVGPSGLLGSPWSQPKPCRLPATVLRANSVTTGAWK